MIDNNINMRNQSLIKQIKCPRVAKSKYNTKDGWSDSSLKFVVEKAIPEVTGYMAGYNFTGLGSNESSNWKARSGFAGVDKDDEPHLYRDRVLGYNYFIPVSGKCSMQSDSGRVLGDRKSH